MSGPDLHKELQKQVNQQVNQTTTQQQFRPTIMHQTTNLIIPVLGPLPTEKRSFYSNEYSQSQATWAPRSARTPARVKQLKRVDFPALV